MMITKEEALNKINKFSNDVSVEFTALQDNIMLECEKENGEFDYRKSFKLLKDFREEFDISLKELLISIPLIDTKEAAKGIDTILDVAQDLRLSNPSNELIDQEIQKMVDSIFDEAYYVKKELKLI